MYVDVYDDQDDFHAVWQMIIGIIGNKPNTAQTRTLRLHICSMLVKDFPGMTSGERSPITSDSNDRAKSEKLQETVDPLKPVAHSEVSDDIVQIVSGRKAIEPTVNVHETVAIGQQMMKENGSPWL